MRLNVLQNELPQAKIKECKLVQYLNSPFSENQQAWAGNVKYLQGICGPATLTRTKNSLLSKGEGVQILMDGIHKRAGRKNLGGGAARHKAHYLPTWADF